MHKRALAELPVVSTSLSDDPTFLFPGGDAELRFEYRDAGETVRGGIRFEKVRAFRFRAESHCAAWHVEDAYDTLVEVKDSPWTAELLDTEPPGAWGKWKIRHFLIYLDSAGAFEVAAASWSWLPEERVS